jgi:hypothetical protein
VDQDEELHLERSSFVQNPLWLFAVFVALLLVATFRVAVVVLLPSRFFPPLSSASVIASQFESGCHKSSASVILFNSDGGRKVSLS